MKRCSRLFGIQINIVVFLPSVESRWSDFNECIIITFDCAFNHLFGQSAVSKFANLHGEFVNSTAQLVQTHEIVQTSYREKGSAKINQKAIATVSTLHMKKHYSTDYLSPLDTGNKLSAGLAY